MNGSRVGLIGGGDLPEISVRQSVRLGKKKQTTGLVQTMYLWHQRSCQRRELRVLAESPELLQDVGLSFCEVQREGRKPFWIA